MVGSNIKLDRMAAFSTIGRQEMLNVVRSLRQPLSGYIGGDPKAGYWVERLADEWKTAFGVPYAIPCNSATSGLLAACMAVGIGPGDEVWTTPFSMSATAACAKVLGAKLRFIDIERLRLGIDPKKLPNKGTPKAIIVANIFGHPAHLRDLLAWCSSNNVWLIEDNAQAPFATEGNSYTGTIGHIGVFSLNVHKHIQCGEGGVIVTRDDDLSIRLSNAINHGELAEINPSIGLNLRMTEPIAAIACAQLDGARGIIEGRREIALEMNDIVKGITWIAPFIEDAGCKHVYYLWTAVLGNGKKNRKAFIDRLIERGIPVRDGYAPLLTEVFNSKDKCLLADYVNKNIIVFEVCAWDVKKRHLNQMRDIILQEAERADANREVQDRE